MNKLISSLLFALAILSNHEASAFGLSNNDVKKLCKKGYDAHIIDLLHKGQLGAEAFNELDPSSTVIFAVGKNGTIFVKVSKSGKVYRLNSDNVFELADFDDLEEIVFANEHRVLNVTQLSQGSILGLDYVSAEFSIVFWTIPWDSSSEEEQGGVNSYDDFSVDSSDIYEASLSQENSLSFDSSVDGGTFTVNTTVEYHSENDMEVLPYNLPSLDLFGLAENSNHHEHFTSSELLRSNSFDGWADELPLFGSDTKSSSPAKKKRRLTSLGCGSELNLGFNPKGDDNDGDEDYLRFFNFAS